MSTKTITITNDAYEALARSKAENESFSKTILRITKRRPLSDFYGIFTKEEGDALEKAIYERRKKRNVIRQELMKKRGFNP